MNSDDAVLALSALAYGARMDVFRVLVAAGEDGMPAGRIAEHCGLSASTLSFHLNQLKAAGLVSNRRLGRSLIYSANAAHMRSLIAYLGETLDDAGKAAPASPFGPAAGVTGARYTVLFVGTSNAARSIMAEAILNRDAARRWRAFSAGLAPADEASGLALRVLARLGHAVEGLHPKPLQTFAGQDAPAVDLVVTLSEEAAALPLVDLPGRPPRSDWPLPAPLAVVGTEAELATFHSGLHDLLHRRIAALAALPVHALDRMTLQRRLDEIARESATTPTEGAA